MVRLRVLHRDDDAAEPTPDDVARLQVAMAKLRVLLDSPIALMERAQAILEGTAEPLFLG